MSKTLFKKLMVTHLVVILISIAVLGVFLSQLMKNYFLNMKEDELTTKGQEISSITAQYLKGELDEDTTRYIINSLERFVDARVWVVDKNGLIRMVSRGSQCGRGRMMMRQGFQLPPEETNRVLNGETVKQVGESPHFTEPMVSVAVPIVDRAPARHEVIGAVFLHAPVTGVTVTLQKVYTFLIIATLVAVILAGLLAVYLSKAISNPLHQITAAALAMAKGDYQTRVKVQSSDEVGELAASFNYMGDKLSETIDALHQEKSKIESLIMSLGEGVIATDRTGTVVRVNTMARKLMQFAEDPIGRNIKECCSGGVAEIIQKVLEEGIGKSATLKKENITVLALASPIKDSRENISGTVCVLQDISEAEKLEQMRKDFVSDVSHELRTPLTAIRGYNEALSDGTVEDPEIRQKYHNIIREETQRLERLIHDLLDLSRLQSGKISLELEPLDVGAVIRSTVEKLEPQINIKGIAVELDIPQNIPYIMGNEDRLVQLLIILLDNAVRYTDAGGKIFVSVGDVGLKGVEIAITDTGKGIPKEDIPFIWERFYKVDKSRTRTGAGTGLGLAIARQIVELHHGTIEVESELGRGTTFKIVFPLAES